MSKSFLIYTCVSGGYDKVYPPLSLEADIDYVIFTDDPSVCVEGWQTQVINPIRFSSLRLMNRYFKMLVHRDLEGYKASLYVDGNIRLLGNFSALFDRFLVSGSALGLFSHPQRETVAAEIEACAISGKADHAMLMIEYDEYRRNGFRDDVGLIEATILLKNHKLPEMDEAMVLWWSLYQHYQTRDQVSLPYVLWKTGVSSIVHDFSFRHKNPYFGIYPHHGASSVPPLYSHLSARSFDSLWHKVLLRAWEFTWSVRRAIRHIRG